LYSDFLLVERVKDNICSIIASTEDSVTGSIQSGMLWYDGAIFN